MALLSGTLAFYLVFVRWTRFLGQRNKVWLCVSPLMPVPFPTYLFSTFYLGTGRHHDLKSNVSKSHASQNQMSAKSNAFQTTDFASSQLRDQNRLVTCHLMTLRSATDRPHTRRRSPKVITQLKCSSHLVMQSLP